MKIFFHAPDNDGKCSGAILARHYPNATIIPYNYWYLFNKSFGSVEPNEPVIFTDITPRIEELKNLMVITKDITIIDHHGSSAKDLREAGLEFPGIITGDEIGACISVWKWCYPEVPVPKGVQYLGDYDAWQHNPENKAFHFGMLTFNNFPTAKIWDKILSDDERIINFISTKGSNILDYLVSWYHRLVKTYSMIGKVGEYSAIFLNQGGVDSTVFDSLTEKYDLYLRGTFSKDQAWHISMTTNRTDLDVSLIAKQFGGGGHMKAAGFIVSRLEDVFVADLTNTVKMIEDKPS